RDRTLSAAIGIEADELAWALNDRIPLFIRTPRAGTPDLSGARSMAAGQTDLAPTLLALLGIDPAPLPYVGRNLLGQPDNPPIVPLVLISTASCPNSATINNWPTAAA